MAMRAADGRGRLRGLRRFVPGALVPAIMALGYLALIIYFRASGGYKAVRIEGEKVSGGVEAPVH